MSKKRDLTGYKVGMLTVLYEAEQQRAGKIRWYCQCACGNFYVASMDHLTRKHKPVKSCGCLGKLRGKDYKLWQGYGDISGNWWYNHVLRERKQTARVKLEVSITIKQAWELFLKQDGKCALSGVPLRISSGAANTASIDRIDSSVGYRLGNIQWVHKHINFMKRTYSQKYFIHMCTLVAKQHQQIFEK